MALKESITTEFELYKWLRGTSLSDSYTFPALRHIVEYFNDFGEDVEIDRFIISEFTEYDDSGLVEAYDYLLDKDYVEGMDETEKAEEVYNKLEGDIYIYKLENGNYIVRE